MPVLLRWNGYKFLFYSKEPGEPPHIHVLKDDKQLKFWLSDMSIARNEGFAAHEANTIMKVAAQHRDEFLEAWLTSLDIDERQLRVSGVEVTDQFIIFAMADGRRIEAPLWWYPRLAAASLEQRSGWQILPFGDAVGWEEIDEYISAKALIIGGAAPGAIPPAQAAE